VPSGGTIIAAQDKIQSRSTNGGRRRIVLTDHQPDLNSLEPIQGRTRPLRRRLDLKDEIILAFLPTLTVLAVMGLVSALSQQRLLFASLAASAFLIYLDPRHATNQVRTLVLAQMSAAFLGLITYLALGPGFWAGGAAMVATIGLMVLADVVHPPAVSTSLAFAFRAGPESNLLIFALAVLVTAALVVLEKYTIWQLARFETRGKV
jgi:CBS-domain-containing membrane protein